MARMTAFTADDWPGALRRGFAVKPRTILLIAIINTVIALFLWMDDPRPFWHPFISAQCFGFAIAYCVNVASPWERRHLLRGLALAVLAGAFLGMVLTFLLKGYTFADLRARTGQFGSTVFMGFVAGLAVSV